MDWFLIIVHMTLNGDVAGSERKIMATEADCRKAVNAYEYKVIHDGIWVRCDPPPAVQTAETETGKNQ
jgi:hypothetical protein